MGTVGRTCYVPDDFQTAIISSHLIKVSLDQDKATPPYISWVLNQCPAVIAQIRAKCQGAIMDGFNSSLLKSLRIPLPPLPEQRRIAAILDKADAIRSKQQRVMERMEDFLRSVFLDMFGDPVTNPKGWPEKHGADVFDRLQYGTSIKCHDKECEEDFPVLRIPNIIGEYISYDDLKFVKLSEKEVKNLSLKQGDILFVRTNGNPDYIGRCAVYMGNSPMLFASYLIRAQVGENSLYRPEFLKTVVSFPSYRSLIVREARTTAGNYNISIQGLNALRFISPPLEKQDKFLALAVQAKNQIEKQKRCLMVSDVLLKTLTHLAFRGELTSDAAETIL
jgi:type I restriction enzyme S subunit